MDENDEEYSDDNYLDIGELLGELYPDKEFYYIEDFDDAIIGIVGNKIAYSKLGIINILCDDMKLEDAIKYYDENIENGYYGEKTPIFVNDDILNFFEEDGMEVGFSAN